MCPAIGLKLGKVELVGFRPVSAINKNVSFQRKESEPLCVDDSECKHSQPANNVPYPVSLSLVCTGKCCNLCKGLDQVCYAINYSDLRLRKPVEKLYPQKYVNTWTHDQTAEADVCLQQLKYDRLVLSVQGLQQYVQNRSHQVKEAKDTIRKHGNASRINGIVDQITKENEAHRDCDLVQLCVVQCCDEVIHCCIAEGFEQLDGVDL